MALIQLPFLKGADQSVDPKIAPLGVLKSAKNVRFDREGRIVKRPGFDAHSVTSNYTGTPIGDSAFSSSTVEYGIQALFARGPEKVAIAGDRVCSYTPASGRWRDWNPISPWSAPERFAVGKNLVGRALRPSVAYANGYVCVVFESNDASLFRVYAAIYDATTLALVSFYELGASNAKRPRVIAMGNKFMALWLDTTPAPDVLAFSTFDTTSPTSGWTAPGGFASGFATVNDYFDLCAYSSTAAFYIHGTTANRYCVAKIDASGAVTASVAFSGGAPGAATVFGDSGIGRILTAFDDGGYVVREYTAALGGGSSQRLTSDTNYMGQPVIGLDGTSGSWRVSVSQEDAVTALDQQVRVFDVTPATLAFSEVFDHPGCRLASKSLALGSERWCWLVNKSNFDRTYYLRELVTGVPVTVAARSEAVDAIDSDRHVSEFISYTVSGRTFALWAAPVVAGQDASAASPLTSVDLIRVEYGGTERFQGATVGGNLYLTGGVLSMFDGALAHESGWLDEPRIISGVAGGGGSLTPSKTYQYLLTHHWLDANGLLHLSGVSDPVSVALGGGDSSVTLKWQRPRQSWRRPLFWRDSVGQPDYRVRQHLWRTEGNGQIFHQLTDEFGYSVQLTSGYGSVGTLTDVAADTTIQAKAVVYTQGARGGLSGPLQHDPPPPCRYIWAGKERAIIGGLESSGELRWSKFYFTGEALEFSEDLAFRKQVPGNVRGVAMLDDVSLAFTETQVFVITGIGPDDTGSGTFDEPKALPSDVGLVTWKSLVEWSGGLFFQGKSDLIHLLPRGIGAPQPQLATQEFLRTYPTITSARLVTEQNLVVFTLTGGAGGKGALLCFDTENGQWTLDEVAGGVEHVASAVVSGNLLLATSTALDVSNESSFVDRGSQFVPISLETAWLRPHGMQADGRTRKVAVLGEYQADCSLQMQLAVDDSPSYAYTKTWALGAGTPGTPLRREWDLPVQKFGSCALRIAELRTGSSSNAGFVLHGVTLETHPRRGMPRLKQGFR